VACTTAAVFPDIDIIAGRLAHNSLAIMQWHRYITHSLLLLPLWAVILAASALVVARVSRLDSPSFFGLIGICAVGLATHVFLDLVTDFGTMIWSPLDNSRPAWDWLFILDLTLTSLALVPQLAAWCYRVPAKSLRRARFTWGGLTAGTILAYLLARWTGYPFALWIAPLVSAIFAFVLFAPQFHGVGFRWRRSSWCLGGTALVFIYLACAAVMHGRAMASVEDFIATNSLRAEKQAALPLPPMLTHWSGVIGTSEGVWRTTFYLSGGGIERTQFYSTAKPDRFIEAAKKLRSVQIYLWFARFPVWYETQRGDTTAIDISDVRFFRESDPEVIANAPGPRGFAGVRTNPAGFTFEVVFDAAGQPVYSGFKRR
jgi:membrane-bound metal-dependent hydrolase YbcI (DUF457 family)